jgi:superfamily II DNA/RNA helicase
MVWLPPPTFRLRYFIFDKADEMISAGLTDQIYDIFKFVPQVSAAPVCFVGRGMQKIVFRGCDQRALLTCH